MTVTDLAADALLDQAGPEALWVGEWRVASDLNQIVKDDTAVRLEPKAMAVLLHLAARPGQVASRDELLAAVWPGLVVGDNALTQAVIKLRKALGDTAREPTYVQSVAKKGYRLIAEVRRSTFSAPDDHPVVAARPVARHGFTAGRFGMLMFAAALLAAMAWAWRSAGSPAAPPVAAQPGAVANGSSSLPTIFVEPFEALGLDARQSPIAQAIGADLVTELSKVSGMRVASRSLAGAKPGAAERASGGYLLSGTVQEDGDRLRLHVLLAEAGSGREIWSERFDRRVKDLFSMQDDLVRSILAVLPVKVSDAETLRLARRDTLNLDAYRQFMRAQAALLVRRPADNETARGLYWNAIRLDPSFARAYAGVAMTYALAYQQGWAPGGEAALGRASEIAHTAVEMNPDLPEVHWVLGFVHEQRRQPAQALQELERAVRLNPSYADAYALQAGIETYIGRPADSIPLLREALRLNPDAGSLYFLLLGRAYYFLGDAEQARVNLNVALERNADNLEAHVYLGATDWLTGDRDSAAWQVNEIRSLQPGFSADPWLRTYPMTDSDQVRRLRGTMIEMGL